MSTPQDPGRAQATPGLTALPQLEEIPQTPGGGYDVDRVRDAFDAYRRHVTQLQSQLRVLQAAGRPNVEPTGHAVRMDALHLVRAAAEFADTIERDAQQASANQLARTEEEVRGRQRELQEREREIERFRQESERQRAEIVNAARSEARELVQKAERDASQEVREAEARAARLVEQARHQATELANATRAEVEQTLEWARAQSAAIVTRAQQGAGQLLAAAGLSDEQIGRVADAIVRAADQASAGPGRAPGTMPRAGVAPQPSQAAAGPQVSPASAEPQQPSPAPSERPPSAEGGAGLTGEEHREEPQGEQPQA
jgi:F0F1-type ATP synthase membrane subunit b/b'